MRIQQHLHFRDNALPVQGIRAARLMVFRVGPCHLLQRKRRDLRFHFQAQIPAPGMWRKERHPRAGKVFVQYAAQCVALLQANHRGGQHHHLRALQLQTHRVGAKPVAFAACQPIGDGAHRRDGLPAEGGAKPVFQAGHAGQA